MRSRLPALFLYMPTWSKSATFCLALLSTAAFGQAYNIVVKDKYQQKGFVVRSASVEGSIKTTIWYAVISPDLMKARIAGYTPNNLSGMSAIRALADGKAKVVLGSGFVKSYFPLMPQGFLKMDGHIISKASNSDYTEIIAIKNGKVLIMPRTKIEPSIEAGFQVGPILVNDGGNEYEKRKYYARPNQKVPANRAFLAINNNGKLIAAVTEGPVTLRELAAFLTSKKSAIDLNCTIAVNLSGGSAETLVIQKSDGSLLKYGEGAEIKETSLLVFY